MERVEVSGLSEADRDTVLHWLDPVRVLSLWSPDPDHRVRSGWLGLEHGVAGLAVLCTELAQHFADAELLALAHHWLLAGLEGVHGMQTGSALPLGMAGGLAGLAFAFAHASAGGRQHQQALDTLDLLLFPMIEGAVFQLTRLTRFPPMKGCNWSSGLAGMVPYLLLRKTSRAQQLLQQVTSALVLRVLHDPAFCPPRPHPSMQLGLAHGRAGVLAALALTVHPSQLPALHQEALQKLGGWLFQQAAAGRWPDGLGTGRSGIAAALARAAQALKKPGAWPLEWSAVPAEKGIYAGQAGIALAWQALHPHQPFPTGLQENPVVLWSEAPADSPRALGLLHGQVGRLLVELGQRSGRTAWRQALLL